MNRLKNIALAALLGATALVGISAGAQTMDHGAMHGAGASAPATEMTDGEIRKVDRDGRKLTIRHGEIKNLEMPGMTMVFQVRDAAMVDKVKVGDKVRFRVEKGAGGFVVTELQPAGKQGAGRRTTGVKRQLD